MRLTAVAVFWVMSSITLSEDGKAYFFCLFVPSYSNIIGMDSLSNTERNYVLKINESHLFGSRGV